MWLHLEPWNRLSLREMTSHKKGGQAARRCNGVGERREPSLPEESIMMRSMSAPCSTGHSVFSHWHHALQRALKAGRGRRGRGLVSRGGAGRGGAGFGLSIAQLGIRAKKICVVPFAHTSSLKTLHSQNLKESKSSGTCYFMFLMGPRISTIQDPVFVLSSWILHWTPFVTW